MSLALPFKPNKQYFESDVQQSEVRFHSKATPTEHKTVLNNINLLILMGQIEAQMKRERFPEKSDRREPCRSASKHFKLKTFPDTLTERSLDLI